MLNNPEQPEPELTRDERRQLKQRLRAVRKERKMLARQRKNTNKMQGKSDKKGK